LADQSILGLREPRAEESKHGQEARETELEEEQNQRNSSKTSLAERNERVGRAHLRER